MGGSGFLTIKGSSCWSTATCGDWWDDSSSACSSSTAAILNAWTQSATVKFHATEVEIIPKKLPAGQRTIELPDGAHLHIDDLGNYRIEDAAAQVTYKANRIREFSPHLNASDMVAKFVEYTRQLGVRQDEVLGLPLELFINWLIIEAAERDQDPVPADVIPVPQHRELLMVVKPKCLACGRFIPRLHHAHRFPFCGPEHGVKYLRRNAPKPLLIAN